jgi:hypothetical protein
MVPWSNGSAHSAQREPPAKSTARWGLFAIRVLLGWRCLSGGVGLHGNDLAHGYVEGMG